MTFQKKKDTWPDGKDREQLVSRVDMWKVTQYFGSRQDTVVLNSSSQTVKSTTQQQELVLILFTHRLVDNTGPGKCKASLRRVGSGCQLHSLLLRSSSEVAAGCGVDVAVLGAPQVSVGPEGTKTRARENTAMGS